MRIKNVAPILVKRYLDPKVRKRAVFLRGKSGIGKSDAVYQASNILGEYIDDWKGVVDLRLGQMDVTDARGVPYVVEGITYWARPDMLPREGSGLLFLDEITSAPPAVQAMAYQMTLTPEDFGIPDTWMVVAAGNSKSDRGHTFNLAAPLQNRMCDIGVETTLDDFIDYAVTKDIRPEILSFLRDRPDLLHKFEGGNNIEAFPSPRSWFAVSDVLNLDLNSVDRVELIKGDVGSEASTSFEAHMRVYETMPRIDDILNGVNVEVPKKLDVVYCVAMGLAMRVEGSNFDDAWKFISKLGGDVQTLIMKLAYKRDKSISNSAAFSKWAVANAEAFRQS